MCQFSFAVDTIQQANKNRSAFLFSRYANDTECNAVGASATLNKRIDRLGIPLICHSLRHTMRDRLRAVECPKEIIDRIGGWSSGGVGESYGSGFKLDVLSRWLAAVAEESLAKKSESAIPT